MVAKSAGNSSPQKVLVVLREVLKPAMCLTTVLLTPYKWKTFRGRRVLRTDGADSMKYAVVPLLNRLGNWDGWAFFGHSAD